MLQFGFCGQISQFSVIGPVTAFQYGFNCLVAAFQLCHGLLMQLLYLGVEIIDHGRQLLASAINESDLVVHANGLVTKLAKLPANPYLIIIQIVRNQL